MASEIVLWDPTDLASADGRIDFRWENTINAPLVTGEIESFNNGQRIADDYELTFTKVGAAVSVTVVCGAGSKNPYTQTATSVTADGTTRNVNVIGGVSFAVSASVVTGWQGVISVGAIMSNVDGSVTDVLNHGIVEADDETTQQQIAAKNVGDADSVDTKIQAVPGMYWTPLSAVSIVNEINNHSDDIREHIASAGSYTITFTNWADDVPSGKKSCDIYVDGGICVATALFDGATRYQYGVTGYVDGTDLLAGLSIILEDTTDDPTAITITLVVADGHAFEWLAPDVAGSPGTWTDGDLTLTESGQISGTVRTGQHADFWNKWIVPDGTSPDIMRMQRFSVRGLTV